MKLKSFFMAATLIIIIAVPLYLLAEEAGEKVIAIGDVNVASDIAGQNAYDVKETIQVGLKKELEKRSKGKYTVNIVSPAVVSEGSKPEAAELPEMPEGRAPTQKEMAKYMAAIQQYQKEMSGQVKKHKPVAGDAYFDFRLASGQRETDTGGVASTIGSYTGLNTSAGDVGTKTTKVYLIATMRDPRTGELMDKYTAKASSVKVRNIAGYSDYSYGSDEMTREGLYKSAIKECAKWIDTKVQ